ncbi:S8 family serine peptidase [Streptomyces sp. NPDC005811]|uniref:S8 family serine peptidase n=1 Tax=Streptomyces sp. NPDC005811 TaxID=3154565 RepID=UPI0033E36E15
MASRPPRPPRVGRRVLALQPAVCALALALALCPTPAPGAPLSDATPAASASAGGSVRLPVIPGSLEPGAPCTRTSPTTMNVTPWTHDVLDLSGAWTFSRGDGVTVAVVDTGVAPGTRSLSGRVTADGTAADDCVGHGSFVAGLIAGASGTGTGADFGGVAPQARVLALRGTDRSGRPSAALTVAAIRAAADARAQVIAVPLALPSGSAELTSAVRYANAHGCLVVAAAVPDTVAAPGGVTASASAAAARPRTYWPAADTDVLAVSDFGPDGSRPDGAPEPERADLAAPGDKVVGTGPRGSGHFTGSGASFATAYVAGAAALVRSREPGLSAEQTKRRLISTAYPADVPRLDVYAALTSVPHGGGGGPLAAAPPPVVLPVDNGRGARRIAGLVAIAGVLSVVAAAATRGAVRGRRRRSTPEAPAD